MALIRPFQTPPPFTFPNAGSWKTGACVQYALKPGKYASIPTLLLVWPTAPGLIHVVLVQTIDATTPATTVTDSAGTSFASSLNTVGGFTAGALQSAKAMLQAFDAQLSTALVFTGAVGAAAVTSVRLVFPNAIQQATNPVITILGFNPVGS